MKKYWQFDVKNQDAADLFIYGIIGESYNSDEGITAKQFKKDLDNLKNVKQLNIYISSLGGSVWEGQSIYSQLKRHKANKIIHIDGIAASIASVIAMAGDTIIIPKNALLMLHRSWTMCMGNSNDLRKTAESLDKVDECILSAYSRSKCSKEKIVEYMDAETWFTAEEAVNLGFADYLDEPKEIAAYVDKSDMEIMSKYKNIPERVKKMSDNVKNKVDNGAELMAKIEAMAKELADSKSQNTDLVAKLDASKNEFESLKAEIDALKVKDQPKEPSVMDNMPEEYKAMIKNAEAQAKAAQEQVKKMQDEQVTNAFIAKSKAYEGLGIKADEFGPALKALSEIDTKYVESIDAVLKAASASAEQGKLFNEIGSSRKGNVVGDSWSKIEANSKALMQNDSSITTIEQSQAKYLETAEGKQLYENYLNERSGN